MSANLNPYLNFRGQAREAMDFYRSVFGGELSAMTFAEGGMPVGEQEQDDVMHAQLDRDGRPWLMGADVPSSMPLPAGSSISVSLSGGPDDDAELRDWFAGLSEGATVHEQLNRAPWGDVFGMLTDRFGVSWLVNITGNGGG